MGRVQINEAARTLRRAQSAPNISPNNDYIVYYCDNCGTELYGAWTYIGAFISAQGIISGDERHVISEIIDKVKKEKEQIRSKTHCLCGHPLSREPGYYAEAGCSENYQIKGYIRKRFDNVDPLFEQLRAVRQEKQRAVMLERAKQVAASCDLPARANVSPDAVAQINASPANLQEYLKNLLALEAGIYSVTTHLTDLYDQKKDAEQGIVHETYWINHKYASPNKSSENLPLSQEETEAKAHRDACQKELDTVVNAAPKLLKTPNKPVRPTLESANIFNKKKVEARNSLLLAEYNEQLSAYEKQMEQYNARKQRIQEYQSVIRTAQKKLDDAKKALTEAHKNTEAQHDKIKQEAEAQRAQELQTALANCPSLAIKNRLEQEIADTTLRMQQLYRCRNELYSYDVVFGKYRDPVALATFYEYLMAGRCESLTGANGAYNLYESECRANLIIHQLDQVINSLEQIKSNQYMIYSSIQMVNASLMQLNSTASRAAESIRKMGGSMDQLAHNSELAAHNTAVTAYYAQLDADVAATNSYMRARFP